LPAVPPAAGDNLAEAVVRTISSDKVVPPNVRSSGPFAEIVKLADSGVDESVLLAFVTNSSSVFNASADEIIYLNDIGVPGSVVAAMIAHDQVMKELAANPTAAAMPAPAPSQYAPTAEPSVPAAPEMASTPDYSTGPYPAPPAPVEAVDPGFQDTLAPYGTWVNVEGYGPCWQPTVVVVNRGWQPYFDGGRWVYTDCGWYWLSDYSWGWAPFHYGRWFRHHRLGWCWAPDNVWGPSWVSWRYTDGYCGWAPLPPGAGYRPGVGLTFRGRGVGVGFDFGLGVDCFAFIAWGHFHDHHLHHYAVAPDHLNRVFHQSTVVTGISGDLHHISNHGLTAEHVSAATHQPVHQVALRDTGSPVSGDRADRLSGDGRTLTVARMHPAPGGVTPSQPGRTGAQVNRSSNPVPPTAPPNHRLSPSTEPTRGGAITSSRAPARSTTPGDDPRGFHSEPAAPSRPAVSGTPSPANTPTLRQPTTRWGATPNSGAGQAPQHSSVPRVAAPPAGVQPSQPAPRVQAPGYASGFQSRGGVAASPPAPSYQTPARPAPVEVPRYNNPAPVERPHFDPGAAPAPAHSYSAPAPSAPAAPSMPSAPAPHSQPAPDRSSHADQNPKNNH
jgi:hypothetical protein